MNYNSSQISIKKEILKEDQEANTTRNNNIYHHSNIGKKTGVLMGAIALPITTLINHFITPKNLRGNSSMLAICTIISSLTGAIGGFTLGSITDYFANKTAKNHADIENLNA